MRIELKKIVIPTVVSLWVLTTSWLHFNPSVSPKEVDLTLHFSKIRNGKGTLRVCAFKNQQTFEDDVPYRVKIFKKEGLKNGALTLTMKVHEGICGIAILDDENNDQEMEFGLILPKEGFGFSNYVHSGMSRPKFENFKFTASDSKSNSVKVMVTYY